MSITMTDKKRTILDTKVVAPDENSQFVRSLLSQAGHIGRGAGMECVGYAVVFVYHGIFTPGVGETRCHSEVKMLTEGSANDAFKTLGSHLKSMYHKPKG